MIAAKSHINIPPIRHILSLSGGKDSAALAIYTRDRVPEMEYIFHDTYKELPETYEYLTRLEAVLGKRIVKTTAEQSFDHWLTVFGGMIPSNHRRWCTKMLKLKPFEKYIGDSPVMNYVGLRADEKRIGYISHKPNITTVYPFREDGLVKADILQILEESGLGLPRYTEWGRTRSGCFFCFYQQKIEWVRLKQKYPEMFEEAKAYEYVANKGKGEPFYWCGVEPLAELERPERMEEIERKWLERNEKLKKHNKKKRLVNILGDGDEDEGETNGCLICQL
jgi:3'-phosphoadenosine 5'-phosphosulfate sulfotransferase (PAPS reductase)/FAD synthetase